MAHAVLVVDLNSKFSFYTGDSCKTREPNLPNYLSITVIRSDRFLSPQKPSSQSEMQRALSGIWTLFVISIFLSENHNANCASNLNILKIKFVQYWKIPQKTRWRPQHLQIMLSIICLAWRSDFPSEHNPNAMHSTTVIT